MTTTIKMVIKIKFIILNWKLTSNCDKINISDEGFFKYECLHVYIVSKLYNLEAFSWY